jgi:hypothetical protein
VLLDLIATTYQWRDLILEYYNGNDSLYTGLHVSQSFNKYNTFAVPDKLCVRGLVYLICKKMAMFIKKPNSPVIIIVIQKGACLATSCSKMILCSPERIITGIKKNIDITVLYIISFLINS